MEFPSPKAMTRLQIASALGISYSTLWRLLKRHHINLPPGLIYPTDQQRIWEIFLAERKRRKA